METSRNNVVLDNNLLLNYERIFLMWLAVFLISGIYLLLASLQHPNITVVTVTPNQPYYSHPSVLDELINTLFVFSQYLIILFAMFVVLLAFISNFFANTSNENELRISSIRKIIIPFIIWNSLIFLPNFFFPINTGPLLTSGLFVGLIIMEFQLRNVDLDKNDNLKKIISFILIGTGVGFFVFVLIQVFFIEPLNYSLLYTYSGVLGLCFIILALFLQFKYKLKWNPTL